MSKHNITLLSILLAVMVLSCAHEPRLSSTPSQQDRESKWALLMSIQEGMTEDEVLEIMGHPDEIRGGLTNSYADEEYRWVYGVERPLEFPKIGSVVFGPNKKVFMTYCPALGSEGRCRAKIVPYSESPQKTAAGSYCQIDRVFRNKKLYNFHYLQVSIVNEGDKVFLYPNDNTGIRFSLILEVYDDQKNILLREPLGCFHSPWSFDKSQWPVMNVPPGSRESEEVPIWWRRVNDGILYPGTYYVRVAFPFERGKYYGSNLVKWELKEALDKSL